MQSSEQEWFEPQEGLNLIAALSEHVQANPSAVKNSQGVLSDLEEFRTVFEQARSIGARWNLNVHV